LQTISGRYLLGPLGRGWVDNWEVSLTIDGQGNVTVFDAGQDRFFMLDPDGSYQDDPGDYGQLALNNGVYTLREKHGTLLTFDTQGNLASMADPGGNTVTAGYTGGLLTSLTSSDGKSLTIAYNSARRIQTVTDPARQVTTYTYDATGQYLLSVSGPQGTTNYTYVTGQNITQDNALASITFPDSTHQYFSYDSQGRLIETSRDGNAEPIQYAYTSPGGITMTDASGAMTTMLFNEYASLVMETDPLGNTVQAEYNANQNLTRFTTAGATYDYTYDENGNLIREVDPLGDTIGMSYTKTLNQLASVTDPDGNTTQYAYNAAGDLVSTTYADGSTTSASYNSLGLTTSTTDARGQAIAYQYNPAGQVIEETFADGTDDLYTYDSTGNLLTTTDSTGTTTYTYNSANQLTGVSYPTGEALLYSYDTGGRRIKLVDSTSGFTVNYNYDAVGRLQSLTGANDATLVTYQYDEVGRLAEQDNANGTYTTYAYDADGNLLHLINYGPGGVVQSRFDYTYGALNNCTAEATLDGTWTYTYDAAGQLTHAVFASTNPAVANKDLAYIYDAAGNRIKTILNGATTNYATNDRNEYTTVGGTTYQYDADGNLVSQTDGSGTTTFTYNSLNQLVKVVTPTDTWVYQYNGRGQRVAATHNGQKITYVIDPTGLGNVIAAYDKSGSLVANYAYGLGLVSQTGPSGTDYYQFDAIGSTAALTGANGTIVNSYSYLPFGGVLSSNGPLGNPYQFVGQFGVADDGDGLDFMRARSYVVSVGRFSSPDPFGVGAARVNLYSYGTNDPITKTDPSGKGLGGVVIVIIVVIVVLFAPEVAPLGILILGITGFAELAYGSAIPYGTQPADS
jgi:RHS repeat-associated protein